LPMTVRGGGVPALVVAFMPRENGSAASELRRRCAWLHHGSGLEPAGYKVVARLTRARERAPL
jgi:hypothetical protein